MIRFELPFLLPTLNVLLREGRWRRGKARNKLAWEIVAAIGPQRPQQPFRRARVRVERHCIQPIDPDNMAVKSLLDVLQPLSLRHPCGLGIITDDSAACVTLELPPTIRVRHRVDQKTVVTIEEIA